MKTLLKKLAKLAATALIPVIIEVVTDFLLDQKKKIEAEE